MDDDWTPDLDGQVVVVTGGSRGIGRAVSLAFADAGATVVPTARTADDVEAVAEAIRERGGETLAVTTDVADPDDVRETFEDVAATFGGVDVVVNNAGINPSRGLGLPDDVDADAFDEVVAVNLTGAYTCARTAGEYLLDDGGGSVINVASVNGVVGTKRQHPYTASKHGLVGLTKSLALDWAPTVRVNAIAPGYVRTDLTEGIREDEALQESIADRIPLGRFADPDEVAGPALFLASDAASYVTGSVLTVDGGWTTQ